MAYNSRRTNPASDLFYAWSPLNIAGFWIVTVLIIASVILLNVPIGLSFFLLVFLLPLVWKDPEKDDVINGMMVRETIPWKIATFMNVMKGPARKHIFEIDDLFGVGPPEDDILNGLEESFFNPPTRVSAYFSMGFAFVLSFLDHLINPIIFPLWGNPIGDGFVMPAIVSQVISFIFFYGAIQALNTARRFQLAIPMSGVDKVPAVMWNKIPKDGSIRESWVKFAVSGIVSTGVFMFGAVIVSLILDDNMPWLWAVVIAIVLGLSVAVYVMFRHLSEVYRQEFNFQVERRDFWNGVWGYKNLQAPFFEMQVPVPGRPGKPGGPPEGSDEVPEPHVWVATFTYPVNGTFADYANEVSKIEPSLGEEGKMIAISPVPQKDQSGSGASIPGTVSSSEFRVWWSDINITMNQLLSEVNITPEMKEIAIKHNIIEPLAQIKQINRCLVHSHSMMTAPDSKVNIMRVTIVPPKGVTQKNFTDNLEKISSAIGVQWLRAKKSTDPNGKSVIDLYLGNGTPLDDGIVFPKGIASSRFRKRLMSVHWEYVFAINGITSPNGSPSMILSRNVTDKSEEIIFDLPAGIPVKEVKRRIDSLKSTSGNGYMELHDGVPSRKQFSRKENREMDKFLKNNSSAAQFTLIASKTHPLEDIFFFSTYKDQLITGRERGVAKISWSPGVKSNGELAKHSFEKDDPHLVIAGSSGSGKSALIYNMCTQLCANNYPEDLQFWIIDPKLGFQGFQYIDNVTRYVDQWTPRENYFFEACRDMVRDACIEMARRNKIFRFAKKPDGTPIDEAIDKLSAARSIGIQQGPMADGSPNPLVQPYLILIIDECAMLFSDAPDKETRELQVEILYYSAKLARESRSAGIHCLFSTQYPTKASLPPIIKQQSARIGLQTQDNIASRVIIDEDGLEELWIKGTGKVKDGRNFVDFRGFLAQELSMGETSMQDILDTLPKRTPDPAIDGDLAVSTHGGSSGSSGASDPGYVDAPDVDDSIFKMWDGSKSGTAAALRSSLEPLKDKDGSSTKKGSKADKVRTVLEYIDYENMPDDKFDITLEEFRKVCDKVMFKS